jgi:hypothetical protein
MKITKINNRSVIIMALMLESYNQVIKDKYPK